MHDLLIRRAAGVCSNLLNEYYYMYEFLCHLPLLDKGTNISQVCVLVFERGHRPPCDFDEGHYLAMMIRGFAPFFIQSISRKSDDYLPDDAPNLCKEVANLTSLQDHNKSLNEFLEQYRKRYFGNQGVQRELVLNSCLLSILQMSFDFSSSIQQGLIL